MENLNAGIKPISPTYPLRPVRPAEKDRKSGEQPKKPPDRQQPDNDDGEPKPLIDEHV